MLIACLTLSTSGARMTTIGRQTARARQREKREKSEDQVQCPWGFPLTLAADLPRCQGQVVQNC